jgi:hypothetical protein
MIWRDLAATASGSDFQHFDGVLGFSVVEVESYIQPVNLGCERVGTHVRSTDGKYPAIRGRHGTDGLPLMLY